MFHRHHPRDDIDVSTFREDGNARSHRRNPGNNGVPHRRSKEQNVTKNKREHRLRTYKGISEFFGLEEI